MAHMIEKPWDMVYSIEGTEWHRIADHVPMIGEDQFKRLAFGIIESPAIVHIDGQSVNLDGYKVLVADHRACRDDLTPDQQLVPLHIPKAGYKVIDNRRMIDLMTNAFRDLGAKVTTCGTLERGRKFFISVDIGSSEMVINKDRFRAYANFVTSHDGEIAVNLYDSMTRIVCMNTLRASMEAKGEVSLKVFHTKNADAAVDNLGDLFNAILRQRAAIKDVLEYLATHKCDNNDALCMAAGYFAVVTDSVNLSTRAMNAAQSIATLFSRGVGNKGESLYDLANAATEYWTHGEGVGKGSKTTDAQRTYRAEMGTAAGHKQAFIARIADDGGRGLLAEKGREAIALFNA